MDNKPATTNYKTPLLIALFALIGIAAFKLLRNRTQNVNNVGETISDDATAQATKFYGLFGVKRTGSVAIATPVVFESTENQIFWLAQNIVDWKQVQSAFTQLCGGDYAILQAASTALSSSSYNKFVSYINDAVKRKRVFCGTQSANLYTVSMYNMLPTVYGYRPGDYVGRLQGEKNNYYSGDYYLVMRSDDGITYYAPKDKFILKNA